MINGVYELESVPNMVGGLMKANEFDYECRFYQKMLGIKLREGKGGINAVVSKVAHVPGLSQTIFRGSLIVSCNYFWLIGQPLKNIQRVIRAHALEASMENPVIIRFRAKKRVALAHQNANDPSPQTLQVRITSLNNLKENVTHVVATLGKTAQATSFVKASKKPTWDEMLKWDDWDPLSQPEFLFEVWRHSQKKENPDKLIGSCITNLGAVIPGKETRVQLTKDDDSYSGTLIVLIFTTKKYDPSAGPLISPQ